MDRDQVIATLRQHRTALEQRGVLHAALFGSLARGEAGPDSDLDILIDIDPEQWASMSVYDYVGIQFLVSDLFPGPVDVVNKDSLKRYVRPAVLRDAIYAFWRSAAAPRRHNREHRVCAGLYRRSDA